jgi:hypothetical protein
MKFATHATKKINEKLTVLSSNEWIVRRYYNTDLRRLKNWFLDKWRSNRPANSIEQNYSKARERHSWWDENQLAGNCSPECGTKEQSEQSGTKQRQQVWWIHSTRQNIKLNWTHLLARLSASVSRWINAHLSTYGGSSHMSVHPKPRNAYVTNFFCARSILSQCAP